MPPKFIIKDMLVMVANIGSTSTHETWNDEEPFIDKEKCAMRLVVERRIFLQHKDDIGIITMGDHQTNNDEKIEHVKLHCKPHQLVPNFEMVKYVNSLIPTNYPCHWIEALHVALCFIRSKRVRDPECRVDLIIMNNFKEHPNSIEHYESFIIINELRTFKNLRLTFVGENPLNDVSWRKNASTSELFVLKIVDQGVAEYEQIDDFIEKRRFYSRPPSVSQAWTVNLEVAGVNIPCSAYFKLKQPNKPLARWKMVGAPKHSKGSVGDSAKPSGSDSSSKGEIRSEDIVLGYRFGGKHVPCTAEDEALMKHTGYARGLAVYGFVRESEVKVEYWSGSGSRIFVPASQVISYMAPCPLMTQKMGDDFNFVETSGHPNMMIYQVPSKRDRIEAAEAFYSFVQALADKEYIAVVRKVSEINNVPKMGVLIPRMDDDSIWGLIHVELPFASYIRDILKRPIKSVKKLASKEQIEAMDDFIDSMTIPEGVSDYLSPGKFPNVPDQYYWSVIAERALNPDGPLLPFDDYSLKAYLEPPEDLSIKAEPHLEKLSELFPGCQITTDLPVEKEVDATAPKTVDATAPKSADATAPKSVDATAPKSVDDSIENDTNADTNGLFSPEEVDVKMEELEEM